MENKKSGTRKKTILIIEILILSVMLILFFVYISFFSSTPERFAENLESGQYAKAYEAYSRSEEDYVDSFDIYMKNIVDDYNNSLISYDEAANTINSLNTSGFSHTLTNDILEQINYLYLSKTAYAQANALFEEMNLAESQELYAQVIESDINYSDAQSKIIEASALLEENINQYLEADTFYANNDLEAALSAYQQIMDSRINTAHAAEMIDAINSISTSWDVEFPNEEYTKSTFPNQVATQNGFMYIPYSKDGTHTILKYNMVTSEYELLPIAKFAGALILKDINTVGDYLYFIAGENVVSGKMINNPYNIFRMKNDGSNLQCVAKGDYTHLIAYKDGFYASSYSNGIVKLDRNLELVEQLSAEPALMMQLFEGKLYYTVDLHDPYKKIHVEYCYDGNETVEIRRQNHLRFQTYDGFDIFYRRFGNDYMERIFIYDHESTKLTMVKQDNFIGIYGVLDNTLICAKERNNGRLYYYTIELNKFELEKHVSNTTLGVTAFKNICYENETLIFSTDNGFIITDKECNLINAIDFSQINMSNLSVEHKYNFEHGDDEFYSDEEIVIVEDGFWYYSNPNLNIRIDQVYDEDFDTKLYIAHIRTKDMSSFSVDNASVDENGTRERKFPLNLARQHNAVFATSGDFYDTNPWPGIVIRDGVVYRDTIQKDMLALYPDGSFVCYDKEDDITAEELLEAGVVDTLSFGPILISDGNYGTTFYNHTLSYFNPRNAIGYIEPGHYVFVVTEGRMPESHGVTLRSLAELFEEQGCPIAYNLDGGQSVAMMFMGEYVNSHEGDVFSGYFRTLPEIIYFGTSDSVPDEISLK